MKYLVYGECGEYSDYTLWFVRVFDSDGENAAHLFAAAANKAVSNWGAKCEEKLDRSDWDDPIVFSDVDPQFSQHWSGWYPPRYHVAEVPEEFDPPLSGSIDK